MQAAPIQARVHSLVQSDQVLAQSMFGVVAHPSVASFHACRLSATQQAHSSIPATSTAPCRQLVCKFGLKLPDRDRQSRWNERLTATGASPAAPQPGEPVPQGVSTMCFLRL